MKKFGTLLIVLMIASLVLVACQPKEETTGCGNRNRK